MVGMDGGAGATGAAGAGGAAGGGGHGGDGWDGCGGDGNGEHDGLGVIAVTLSLMLAMLSVKVVMAEVV